MIQGGSPLSGSVAIGGAKNAVLPIMAAALLSKKKSVIRNCPEVSDVQTLATIIASLGVDIKIDGSTIEIDPAGLEKNVAPYDFVRKMRASICLLGALIGRLGSAKVSLPGGCVIGPRPIDLHLKGLKALGLDIKIEHGYVHARTKTGKVRGGEVFLGGRYGPSVLGTANMIMAAVLAGGTTVIDAAACEPEVVDLAGFLNSMGAKITGAGSPRISIEGVDELTGTDYTIIPDRIEAGTYMLAAAITRGVVEVKGARSEHLLSLMDKMEESGVKIEKTAEGLKVDGSGGLKPVDVITHAFPGFPTDLQAQMMALMCTVEGISVVTEKIYPERFMHVAELNRMAADISMEGATAIIKGVKNLSGAPVMASDLRASAALVLAALSANGQTEINRIYHLDRGYEKIEQKLSLLGAKIKRVKANV